MCNRAHLVFGCLLELVSSKHRRQQHEECVLCGSKLQPSRLSLSLCSRHNPNEGGRTAISANWVEDTQAQLSAMMAFFMLLSPVF